MKFKHAILGGTFDHLHTGHKFFIEEAAAKSSSLTIGLVENIFEKKLFSDSIESFVKREASLKDWIKKKRFSQIEIIPINDVFGNSLSKEEVDAIFVTRHGFPNAELINEKRQEKGFPELTINIIDFLKGDDEKVISSTRIRAGEIDREGRQYLDLFKTTLLLPDSLRQEVKNIPSGELIKEDYKTENKFVVSVGDVVSSRFSDADIRIIDFKTQREVVKSDDVEFDISATNKAGTINNQAVATIKKAIVARLTIGKKSVIKITGEEDLLTLPAVLLAPLNSIILYGMPGKGAIKVEVTEEKKEEVRQFLEKIH